MCPELGDKMLNVPTREDNAAFVIRFEERKVQSLYTFTVLMMTIDSGLKPVIIETIGKKSLTTSLLIHPLPTNGQSSRISVKMDAFYII